MYDLLNAQWVHNNFLSNNDGTKNTLNLKFEDK